MSIFSTNQKKSITIEDVHFVIKKLSLEKQLTIAALYSSNRSEEAVMALIMSCLDSWDAKDDSGVPVVFSIDAVKSLSVDVANKLSDEIMSFNNLNKDQVKNS